MPNGRQGSAETLAAALEVDQDPVDGWILVHFGSGALLGALGFDLHTTLKLLILWEVIEPDIWSDWNESLENRVVDVIARRRQPGGEKPSRSKRPGRSELPGVAPSNR